MKTLVRHFAIETYSLYLISHIASGLTFDKGLITLAFAGAGLTAINIFAKPVINLLLLPLNMVTFGLFKWVSSAIALYLTTLLIPNFKITGFVFAGYSSKWLDIPALNLQGLMAFVAFSFVLSLITSLIYWLIK